MSCVLVTAGFWFFLPLLATTGTGFAPRPDYRPLTKFEARGLKLGHGVWDAIFRRVP